AVASQVASAVLRRVEDRPPFDAAPGPREVRRQLGGPEPVGNGAERVADRRTATDLVPALPERRDVLPPCRPRAAESARKLLPRQRRRGRTEPVDDALGRPHDSAYRP